MTPAERKAKLEAAKKLMQEVETDEDTVTPVKPSILQQIKQAAQAAAPKSSATTVKPTTVVKPVTSVQVPAASVPADPKGAAIIAKTTPQPVAPGTGPGGDTRKSGQPSVAETMTTLWKKMRGVK